MALVRCIQPSPQERHNVHQEVHCRSFRVEGPDGQRYLQLDTFGSPDREHAGQVSQSIQFDKQAALQLLERIHATFPDLP
jgi:hypothetical protein